MAATAAVEKTETKTETKPATTPVTKPAGDKPAGSVATGGSTPPAAPEKPATETAAAAEPVAKVEGGDPAKATDKVNTDTGATGAPETYELTLPDGGLLDPDDLTAVETLARANGWTNEQAQAALESHAEALAAQSDRFLTATMADSTYGGTKLEATQVAAKRALDRFSPAGTPLGDQLRRQLDKNGFGNYLPLVALLANIGTAMADDKGPGAGAVAGNKKTAVEKFYGPQA